MGAAMAAALSPAPAHAASEIGPTALGVPGLWNTIVAPETQESAGVRLGLFAGTATVDPAFGFRSQSLAPSAGSRLLALQIGLRPSRGVVIAGNLPFRWTSVDGGASHSGVGDAQLAISMSWLSSRRLRLGSWGSMRIPTGRQSAGLSTGQTEGEFGVHSSVVFFANSTLPETRWHFNVGYRLNKNEHDGYGVLDPAAVDPGHSGIFPPYYPPASKGPADNDELLLRTALEFRRRWAHLFLEASVDWLTGREGIAFKENASWITPGLYLGNDDGPALKVAWAIGLHADDLRTAYVPQLPDWVFSVGISQPLFVGGRDRDGDGIPDKRDRCPDAPEDIDGYQDDDGCPDLDNDGDGIPDRLDLAPNLPEDFDGFEDQDGRPDLDNDLDGIPDAQDLCPNQPEDFNGYQDLDGCPDAIVDRDHDGIPDSRDACPDAPEDIDGFEDQDGCPDLDNDLDGIPDTRDACPNDPEDYNGFRDDDGCPDGGSSGG